MLVKSLISYVLIGIDIPVRDVVNAYRKNKNELWGIKGYEVPKCSNVFLDKPRITKMYDSKKLSYIDQMVKLKSGIPTPTSYDTVGNILDAKRPSGLSKGPRITMPFQIEKDAEK